MEEIFVAAAKQAPSLFILGVVAWQLWRDRKDHEKVMLSLVKEMTAASTATAAALREIGEGQASLRAAVADIHTIAIHSGAGNETQRIHPVDGRLDRPLFRSPESSG